MDYNSDGNVDILDIVSCIGYILSSPGSRSSNNPSDNFIINELSKIQNNGNGVDYLVKLYSKIENKTPIINRQKVARFRVNVPTL